MIYGNVGNIAAAVYLEMQLGGYMKKLTAFFAAALIAVSFAAAAGSNENQERADYAVILKRKRATFG